MTDRPDLDTIEARDQRDAAEAGTIVSTMGALGAVRFSAAHADRYRLLTYARALEQERDAAQAQHDAEIAGIVAMLREHARIDWRAAERLWRIIAEIETTHAAALARHAGRTGGSNG